MREVCILAVLTCMPFFLGACVRDESRFKGIDAGPARAFEEWMKSVEERDYSAMWEQLPITAKERFRYAWDDEREQLEKAGEAARRRFIKVYGFSSWQEVLDEGPGEFFARAMGSYPKSSFPAKYKVLKKARISKIVYGDEGDSCELSFVDENGRPLPMKMKMLREGDEWKVVRLP